MATAEFKTDAQEIISQKLRSGIEFVQDAQSSPISYFDSIELDALRGWHDASLRTRFMDVLSTLTTASPRRTRRLRIQAATLIYADRVSELRYHARMKGLRLELLGEGPVVQTKIIVSIGGRRLSARPINVVANDLDLRTREVARCWGTRFDAYYLALADNNLHLALVGAIESPTANWGSWFVLERMFNSNN